MPFTITLVVSDKDKGQVLLETVSDQVLTDLRKIEDDFSPFKAGSMVSRFRAGEKELLLDPDFQEVYAKSLAAQEETEGAFDPFFDGDYNPTGLVKGWAIEQVFDRHLRPLLESAVIEAVGLNGAGDMQLLTGASSDFTWQVGIEDALNPQQVVSRFSLKDGAIATSGLSKKGQHIKASSSAIDQVTIVANSLVQADIWATALMTCEETRARNLIARHRLSGLYQIGATHHYFQHGVL